MRTTTRIDDDLLEELKHLAAKEDVPLTRVLNRTLRAGLRKPRGGKRARFRESVHSMGHPRIDLRKALEEAARLEDEEAARKLALRK